jgi:hypothetical protein
MEFETTMGLPLVSGPRLTGEPNAVVIQITSLSPSSFACPVKFVVHWLALLSVTLYAKKEELASYCICI